MLRIAIIFLAIIAVPALAQSSIYRTVDENGNVVFTDAPPAGNKQPIERIEKQHINSMPPPDQVEAPAAPESGSDDTATSFTVEITAPVNETTIPNGPGNFSVSARVAPALDGGQSLQLFMDGAPWGDPQRGARWSLTNVFRGQHDITVAVLDGSGETLSMSDPVRVYVFRPIAR